MSKNKRRMAYAIEQKRHVSMIEWASILIAESKWDGKYEVNSGMTESELKDLDELSKLRGWTNLRDEFSLSKNTVKNIKTNSCS